jgi:hypothetical protein
VNVLVIPQQFVAIQVRIQNVGSLPDDVVLRTSTVTLVRQQGSSATGVFHTRGSPQRFVLMVTPINIGGPLVIVTVWLHVLVFPHESTASHVRVMFRGHEPLVTVLRMEIVILLPQQLTAVGAEKPHFDRQPTSRLLGQSSCRQQGLLEQRASWALRNVLSKRKFKLAP